MPKKNAGRPVTLSRDLTFTTERLAQIVADGAKACGQSLPLCVQFFKPNKRGGAIRGTATYFVIGELDGKPFGRTARTKQEALTLLAAAQIIADEARTTTESEGANHA